MNVILFDTPLRNKLLPLTATRAVADLRMGIFSIKERWANLLSSPVFVLTEPYLQPLYALPPSGECIFIDACIIPDNSLIATIRELSTGTGIKDQGGLIASRTIIKDLHSIGDIGSLPADKMWSAPARRLTYPFELFQWNGEMIEFDFALVTKGRISDDTNDTVHVVRPSRIFVEDGASISFSVLNASTGPIYIGPNTTVMEGCHIRGPFALCEGAVLKMGTRIYGSTTIGPESMAGGEIKNSIITGYSNKAHDGYLGDSVIGEWCNLGAGTSNSNLKNNASTVGVWNYDSRQFEPAGKKCGVIMGDYTRTAINSSINTGSVYGVASSVFGSGLLPKLIPDFTWGSVPGTQYKFEKATRDIDNWKMLKNKKMSPEETEVLKHIFDGAGENQYD